MEPKEVTLKDGATPRKVVATSKGSAKHYNDGGFEYSPYESTGESSRDDVVRDGDSVTYKTKGRTPLRVVTLKVKDDDPALCAKLNAQLEHFMEGFGKGHFEEPTKGKKSKAKCGVLWDTQMMKIELNEKENCCAVMMRVPLGSAEDMKQQVFYNLQNINQCFTINKQTILRAFRATSKNSSKSPTTTTSVQS
jgi:hypothetical protein